MKSTKPRKIILRTEKLQNIRKNLRIILKLAYQDEIKRLLSLELIYQDKYIANQFHLSPSQRKRQFELSKKNDMLYQSFIKSILACSFGVACISYREVVKKGLLKPSERPIDLDMVWVPHYKKWYCQNCYEEILKIKACENCRKTDETTAKISQCIMCDRYVCELCENTCSECREVYCDQCFFEHINENKCPLFKF